MDGCTGRDVAQRQVVTHLDVSVGAGLNHGALLQVARRNDVALLAIEVVQQRDVGRAVRVVLDVSDLGWHTVFVVTTEVDQTVLAFVSTALVACGDVAVYVAATGLVQRAQQRLLRGRASELIEPGDRALAATRRSRLVFTNSHDLVLTVRLRRQNRRRCRWDHYRLPASPLRAWLPCDGRSRSGCAWSCPHG